MSSSVEARLRGESVTSHCSPMLFSWLLSFLPLWVYSPPETKAFTLWIHKVARVDLRRQPGPCFKRRTINRPIGFNSLIHSTSVVPQSQRCTAAAVSFGRVLKHSLA